MPDHLHTSTSLTRTSTRKNGKRLTSAERVQAQETFIASYTLNGNIMLSCRRANIDRASFYQWLEHDIEFSLVYHQAEKDFADLALAEFRKRAMEGYEKPVISLGRIVYEETPILNPDKTPKLDAKGHPLMLRGKPLTERVTSDTLLAMLVKRHFPEFKEKQQVDLNTTTTPIDIQALHDTIATALTSFPDAKLAVAAALVEMERAREK